MKLQIMKSPLLVIFNIFVKTSRARQIALPDARGDQFDWSDEQIDQYYLSVGQVNYMKNESKHANNI
jgi:hypothetical protein